MPKGRATRVTAQDIARAEGGVTGFITLCVKRIKEGDHETKETAAAHLRSLAVQNHYAYTEQLYTAGVIGPLVKLLRDGSANAQASAAGALHGIAHDKEDHQRAIVEAGAVVPLVMLLKNGSARVQEDVRTPLALNTPLPGPTTSMHGIFP